MLIRRSNLFAQIRQELGISLKIMLWVLGLLGESIENNFQKERLSLGNFKFKELY